MEKGDKSNVFKDLKQLVYGYLETAPMEAIGPKQMRYKSLFLVGCWVTVYALMLTYGQTYRPVAVACFPVLLLLTCSLEFCIMHDASHYAYSSNRLVNKIALNFSLAMLGGCSLSWHQEHVVRHHGFTNILGSDPDVYASHVLRLHPEDKWHWWQRWQHYYAIPLFSFMWLHWVYNDFVNATFNTYHLPPKKYWLFWGLIFVGLVPHVILALWLPYLAFKSMWVVGIAYMAFFMILSLVMAMTFVLAHVSDAHEYFAPNQGIQKDWAVHQLETTSDFAVNNRFLTFILGGLNFQVEHHIFPAICHLHYPTVQKIVKKYCQENGVVYHEEKTLWSALKRHVAHLKEMSIPPHEVAVQHAVNKADLSEA